MKPLPQVKLHKCAVAVSSTFSLFRRSSQTGSFETSVFVGITPERSQKILNVREIQRTIELDIS